jgi:type IV pilus biogenesis protein CpaD/CtpE
MKHLSAFCLLLLTLLALPAPAQHLTVAQADRLKGALQRAGADTVRLLRLGEHYRRKTWNGAANRDTALAMAREARALSQRSSSRRSTARMNTSPNYS